jgi:hypothetical protein
MRKYSDFFQGLAIVRSRSIKNLIHIILIILIFLFQYTRRRSNGNNKLRLVNSLHSSSLCINLAVAPG